MRLAHLTEAQILDQLIKITVIDPWTEHRALLITRGRIDVVPTGDSSPRHAAQSSSDLGHLAIEDEVTAVAEPWHPYGRVVANLLIGAELDASTQHGRNAAG